MTDYIDLRAIAERCEKATTGPFYVVDAASWNYATVISGGTKTCIAPSIKRADAELLAHSRTDIPDLLSALSERDELIKQMAEALKGVIPYMEQAEDALLVGNEGCHWPVETVRAMLSDPRLKSIIEKGE